MVIPSHKDVEYNIRNFIIPGVRINPIEVPTAFHQAKEVSDQMEFETFTVSFNVDEELKNYLQIYYWIRKNGQPTGFHEYEGRKEDITLILYDSSYKAFQKFTLADQFPVSLSEIEINFEELSTEPRIATVSFEYLVYDLTFLG